MTSERRAEILIVDDDPLSTELLSNILCPFYDISIAHSGKETMNKCIIEEPPDLIILDILMPALNGFDILIELKELDFTRDIPIIFITGVNDVSSEERGLFLGAVDYIRKPFHASIVRARINTHLQIVKQLRAIERSIMIDYLLDISNRRYFETKLLFEWNRGVRKQHPVSLLMIDVDYFKKYNDTYGHPQGDIMLHSIAKVMKKIVNRQRDVLARYGGEEIVALLPETDLDYALKVAESIRARIEKNEVICIEKGEQTKLTVSIGVASTIPTELKDYKSIIKMSDDALYKAKQNGRNQVCF